MCLRYCCFFFSSRRRHTRYWRDWSSDVCSSDLGGMLMTVKFQSAPPLDEVRSTLSKVLANPPSVQTFETNSNEIAIGTEGSDDATLAKNRQLVLDTLAKTFGHPDNGKLDLNNASAGQVADRLRDPLLKAGTALR